MFGKTLKYLRLNENRFTLRFVAKKLSISHVHIYNLENDEVGMSFDLLERINKFYGTNLIILHEVLWGDSLPGRLKEELQNWLKEKRYANIRQIN